MKRAYAAGKLSEYAGRGMRGAWLERCSIPLCQAFPRRGRAEHESVFEATADNLQPDRQPVFSGSHRHAHCRLSAEIRRVTEVTEIIKEVTNRLAYRIVRTIAVHWQELQSGVLLADDFAKAQLSQNDYYPLHPGAVAYYKAENMPLWPWFEDKVRLVIEHRDVVLSVVGGIPTVYTLCYAWYQRRRVSRLMAQIAALKIRGATDRATIENIRMHALTLVAQGKLNRDSYSSLNDFIEAHLHQAPVAAPSPTPTAGESKDALEK